MDVVHSSFVYRLVLLMWPMLLLVPLTFASVIQKKCSDEFLKVCSTGKTENLCCVVGGQRCCDQRTFNEDQSKILKLIVEAEQRTNSHEGDLMLEDRSNSTHKLKKTLIICAACVFGIPFLICILDCLINISKKLRGQLFDCICGRKHEVQFCSPHNEVVEVEKGRNGYGRNRNVSESISERNDVVPEEENTGSIIVCQGPERIDNRDHLPETSTSELQNQERNAQTLSKLEIELIKAQCARIFQSEKLEKLKLVEPNHSNSAQDLPHKYGRFVVDCNRACNSARTSPILQQKFKKKTSLSITPTSELFATNDNHHEVMTLGNRSNNHNVHNQFSKKSGPWIFSTLPHNSSSVDHFVSMEPPFEGGTSISRKSDSPVRNVTSPLFSLEQKNSTFSSTYPKREMPVQNFVSVESPPTSEDENVAQSTV